MKHRLLSIISLALCACAPAGAQALADSVLINFRQSKVYLDTVYMDNAASLQHARQMIDYYHRPGSGFVLKSVTVVGAASPEGSVRFNQWLSHQRAERIFDYIGARYELPDSITTFEFLGRDWEGTRRMVLADPNVPYRDEVLATLDDIIARSSGGETEAQDNLGRIKRLRGGEPYLYMYYRLFPALRESRLVLTFGRPRPLAEPLMPLPFDPQIAVPTPQPDLQYMPTGYKPFYMALKTNMLYDALAVPNIGAEFYLGRNMSIVANWMYAWWDNDHAHRWWRIYGGDLAVRWWFGRAAHAKPLTGHHIGIYGSAITYDFEWGGTGYMGGLPHRRLWDRCNYLYGIEYGYSLPVARRLNIDFTIGLGHWGGLYQVYEPDGRCYVWKETRRRNYWGPTKAEVSLVWLIGRGNVNRGKMKIEN